MISLEAFTTSLYQSKVLIQGPFSNKFPPVLDSVQNLREPFKKRILLTSTPFGLSQYMPLQYDATFHMSEQSDWTQLLTYITYSPKPILVVSEELRIPDGMWSKLQKTTWINFSSFSIVSIRPYDAIFFSPMEDPSPSQVEYSYKLLQTVYRSSYSPKEHKEIISELKAAGAGIGWTKKEDQAGNLYWYDPVATQGEKLSSEQLSGICLFLAKQF